MTRDDIIRMAREAGMEQIIAIHEDGTRTVELPDFVLLERFAALVAAAAMKREHKWMTEVLGKFSITNETLIFIRETIKARGKNENT